MKHPVVLCFCTAGVLLTAGQFSLTAQTPTPPQSPAVSQPQAAAETPQPLFKAEELEQLAAPVALYPDALLAQVLMASTYPLEIVHAARWLSEHPEIKGDALTKEMDKQTWDPSVRSLVAFPDVLAMMNEKLDWTQKLGDAFLAQRKELMDAVQRLRARAKDAGHLSSGKEQTVKTEAAPPDAATPQVIVIESSNPEVVYVPTYNPTVVYGAWPYPAYPPYYYYPPGYAAGAAFFSFSVGVFAGAALWGGCNWGHGDVDIDVNRYNNFNRNNINVDRRQVSNSRWEHDSRHRQGVGYRDSATQQKYNRGSSLDGVQAREDFRGRTDSQQFSRDGTAGANNRGGDQFATRDGGAAEYRDLGGGDARNRDTSAAQSRIPDAASRADSGGAFSGVGNGASTRGHSNRGRASRGGGGRRR